MLSSPEPSRRKFIRSLAAGSAAVAYTAGAGCPGFSQTPSHPVPESGLVELHNWLAAGMNWQTLHEHFLLDPQLVYLNTGTLGACPRIVVDAHTHFLREIERNPAHLLFGSMGEQMEAVRKVAADFLGANLDEIMLTANTTSGMNLVAGALPLQTGDEVLTTNEEHPGGRVCWEYERSRRGVVIREFALDMKAKSEREIVDAVKAALSERTRVISLSHVSTISGIRMPVAAISKLARERGIFTVVDGAQSAGMLNINLHELGCDAFATSAHKWLLAPKGSGVLFLRKEFQPHISSVYSSRSLRSYTAASGTRNVPQILAQGRALDFLNAIGRQRIEDRALSLARRLRQRLSDIPGIAVVSPSAPELQSAIVTLQIPMNSAAGTGAAASQHLLERHGIVVKPVPGEHLGGRGIRVSTHFYNTEHDIEQFVKRIQEMATRP